MSLRQLLRGGFPITHGHFVSNTGSIKHWHFVSNKGTFYQTRELSRRFHRCGPHRFQLGEGLQLRVAKANFCAEATFPFEVTEGGIV